MPKQASLNDFMISMPGTPTPQTRPETLTPSTPRIQEKSEKPKLTVVIVKHEPVVHGRCCFCKRETLLPFCLEYFDSQSDLIMWGDICKQCVDKLTAERRMKMNREKRERLDIHNFNQISRVAQLKVFSHGFRMEEEPSTYNMKNATEMSRW